MLEYLFFNRSIADLFIEALMAKEVAFLLEQEVIQNAWSVKIQEGDLDGDLWDQVDEIYDDLSVQDQQLLELNEEDEDGHSSAGIYIQLANGRQTIAKVNPAIMNRMLEIISMDELNEFIEAVVASVENPDDSPICVVE